MMYPLYLPTNAHKNIQSFSENFCSEQFHPFRILGNSGCVANTVLPEPIAKYFLAKTFCKQNLLFSNITIMKRIDGIQCWKHLNPDPPHANVTESWRKKMLSAFFFWRHWKQNYWCYYPHWLRDLVSPVCGIFEVGFLLSIKKLCRLIHINFNHNKLCFFVLFDLLNIEINLCQTNGKKLQCTIAHSKRREGGLMNT